MAESATKTKWTRIGLRLVVGTMAYNAVEAVIAIVAGVQAASIALIGFGLDSVIEFLAAAALLWRLRLEAVGASCEVIERGERRVHRFVGVTFMALSVYVVVVAGWTLWAREAPRESPLGIGLAVASLTLMPLILACSYLSFTLLLGLVANALAGWWWADPLAALLMVPWLLKEGWEGIRGEACD
jgi:hypothetical protein